MTVARVGRTVRVSGLVQGVFYRAWTAEQARELGVTGWVRNCADGSVEAHLAGEAEAVEQMTQRMRRGPPAAQVAHLSVTDGPPEAIDRFEVRH